MSINRCRVRWDMPVAGALLFVLVTVENTLGYFPPIWITPAGTSQPLMWMYNVAFGPVRMVALYWVLFGLWRLARVCGGPGTLVGWATGMSILSSLYSEAWNDLQFLGPILPITDGLIFAARVAGLGLLALALVRWDAFPAWLGYVLGAYAAALILRYVALSSGTIAMVADQATSLLWVVYVGALTALLFRMATGGYSGQDVSASRE